MSHVKKWKRSFMYILNKIGPKTDPCGIPCSNSHQELKERLMLVFVNDLINNLITFLTNLCWTYETY